MNLYDLQLSETYYELYVGCIPGLQIDLLFWASDFFYLKKWEMTE